MPVSDSSEYEFERLPPLARYSTAEASQRSVEFLNDIRGRRSIRDFSDRSIPQDAIKNCLLAAGTAPNGANLQPWHFAVVQDPKVKKQIRAAAEKEEFEFYHGKAPEDWLDVLAPLGTDESKPFLEVAPCLIVVFAQSYGFDAAGAKQKHYYVNESVGIATGFLINALHHCGIGTLTHTPSPMKFLNEILGRPSNERPFVLLVAGYPADDCKVPKIEKKPLGKLATWH